ncbi:MAG: hypothetical protein PVJ39_08475 [Gammaproteobacteria bacterium]|jgi:hypothetical protein
MMHLNALQWYLVTVAVLISAVSAWGAIIYDEGSFRDRLRHFGHLFVESAISAAAYWVLIFVLALVAATALWLIILLLVWVPSDFFQHYFGADVFSRALQNIKPLIYRAPGSPGLTAIPLLDYLSLYSAYIFGPWCGIWASLAKYQGKKRDTSTTES